MKVCLLAVIFVTIMALSLPVSAGSTKVQQPTQALATDRQRMQADVRSSPIMFIENAGQFSKDARFRRRRVQGETFQPSISPLGVEIVSGRFYPTSLTVGETLQIEVVIRNSSSITIPTQGPPPGYRYREGDTVSEQGITGAWRIGVDYTDRTQVMDHPYRWGFGHDLAPGEVVTVSGFITLTTPRTAAYWIGLVEEWRSWHADNVSPTIVTTTLSPNHVRLLSDSSWKYSETFVHGWETISFDDSSWNTTIAPSEGLCYPPPHQLCWDDGPAQPMWGQNPINHQVLYLRKTFVITDTSSIVLAFLKTGSDDDHDLYINGTLIDSDWDGVAGPTLTNDLRPYLIPGVNTVAIKASDTYGVCQSMCVDGAIVRRGPTPTLASLTAMPSSVRADGTSISTVSLSNASPGHRVRFISSRSNVDTFLPTNGTVDISGCFIATIRSSTPGIAVITAQDLTTGQAIPASATITFTPVSGEPSPPPANDSPIAIIGVESSLPLAGMYPTTNDQSLRAIFGDTFLNHIGVTVDWRGSIPGWVDFIINGRTHRLTANSQGSSYQLDMSRDLQKGINHLQIVAYNAAGQRSQELAYAPLVWEMPPWLVQLLNDANILQTTQAITPLNGTHGATAFIGQIEIERVQNPKAVNIWFKIPPRNLISRVYVPVGKFETEGVQVYARLQIPLEGWGEIELRGGSRYLNEFERRRAAGFKHKGLSILGAEFVGETYVFGRARFDLFVLRPGAIGGGASYQVSKTWERTWLALLYLIGLPDPTPILQALPVVGESVADFVARIASGYFTLEGRGSADFTYQLDPVRQFDSFDLALGAGAEIGMRADIGVAEIKGYYGADVDSTFLCLRNALERDLADNLFCDLAFKGGGRMQVKAFAWEIPVLEFPSFEKHWPEASLTSIGTSNFALGSSNGWRFIRHISTPDYARFRALSGTRQTFAVPEVLQLQDAGLTAQTAITSVLLSNVYTYTEPSLALNLANDNALLLWVHDDVDKPLGQNFDLAYSRWDGSAWSTPARVTDDTYLDSAPQVAWDSTGSGLAVWERLDDPALLITATLDTTTTQKIEIAWAQCDPASNTWSAPAWLTTNTALDHKPYLARNSEGQFLAVWRQNPAGLLSGDEAHPDRIMAAFYNEGWGAPSAAVDGIPGLVDLAAGYGNGVATIAYTRFLIPTGSITPTLQLFTSTWDGSTWSPPQQLTDDDWGHTNPQVAYNTLNQPLLVWQAGQILRLRNLTTGAETSLSLSPDLVIDEFRLLHDAADNLAAVFTGQYAGQRDLFVAFFDANHSTWGRPYRLTNDRHSEGYPAPVLDSTGRLLMAYALTQINLEERTTTDPDTGEVITYTLPVEGQTDLHTLSHQFVRDLAIGSLAVSDDHPLPETTVTVSATVTNTGALALVGVQVAFYDGDPDTGGVLIGVAIMPDILAAGYTATLTATYTIPTMGEQRQLVAMADPQDQIAEADETNNRASLFAFGPDLELAGAGVDYWGGSSVGLISIIRNIGTTASPATTIAYRWEAITGTLVVTDIIPSLAAGEAITLTTPWDYGTLTQGSYTLVAVVNERQQDFAETFMANNEGLVTLAVLPDLAVSPLYLWTAPFPDGKVVITATVYNFGSVPAPPTDVAFYADEALTDTACIQVVSLPVLDPASSTAVTVIWDNPTSGEHTFHVAVNPDRAVTETTWLNNLASIKSPFAPLHAGWNFISFRLQPASTAIRDVLQSIDGQYDMVIGETGAFVPSLADEFQSLREMRAGQSYWVRVTAAQGTTLLLSGDPVDPATSIPLTRGWRWPGYLPNRTLSTTAALQSIAGQYDIVRGERGTYVPGLPDIYQTLRDMRPGEGYQIRMTADGALRYPSDASSLAEEPIVPAVPVGGACAHVRITPYALLAYGEVTVGDAPAPPGTVVEAITPRGDVAGCFVVVEPGHYGLVELYGEDPDGVTPGWRMGEPIYWRVNGREAQSSVALMWDASGEVYRIDLSVGRLPYPIFLPLLIQQGR